MKSFVSIVISLALLSACSSQSAISKDGQTVKEEAGVEAGDGQDEKLNDSSAGEKNENSGDETGADNDNTAKEENGGSEYSKIADITDYNVSCSIDDKEYASGKYSRIDLAKDYASDHEKLSKVVADYNDSWKGDVEYSTGIFASDVMEIGEGMKGEDEMLADILRADDTFFTIKLSAYSYAGGAHPYSYISMINLDPVSGNVISVKSVLDDDRDFVNIVYDELIDEYAEYFFDGEEATKEAISQCYNEYDNIHYYISGRDIKIHFNTYALASYAAGDFDVTISADDYPGLIKERFLEGETSITDKIERREDKNIINVEPRKFEDYEGEGYEGDDYYEEADHLSYNNPSWEYYVSDAASPTGTLINVDKKSQKDIDYLDTDEYIERLGVEDVFNGYSDGIYRYSYDESLSYDYMFQTLNISDAVTGRPLYSFDLNSLMNSADAITGTASADVQFIRCAKIYESVLYVSFGHNGYASVEPRSNYIAAISLETGELLWKSEPLVSNARNFLVIGDAIICGYGFTAEPDYIYVLDLGDGSKVQTIPVRSAPEVFYYENGIMSVGTYNSEYEFEISFG
ncbi:RsiV family protein [Butyrivibrio sp. MC2013]|uniref:RsiV family protein n=1 Tax=Butyrivibrio sp. MC2013 TaxID=1280686 RepID=UPI0004126162|nr:RsiV family protein [Butyrivibrio sp. MC2013]